MNNELAYEILVLVKDKSLHSHNDVHPELIKIPKFRTVTPKESKEIWEALHSQRCLILTDLSHDEEYLKKYPSAKRYLGNIYTVVNPENDCTQLYLERKIKDRVKEKEDNDAENDRRILTASEIQLVKKQIPDFIGVKTRGWWAIIISIGLLILELIKWIVSLSTHTAAK